MGCPLNLNIPGNPHMSLIGCLLYILCVVSGGVPLILGMNCSRTTDIYRYQKIVFYLAPRASSAVSKTKEICWICYKKQRKSPIEHHFAHALLRLC